MLVVARASLPIFLWTRRLAWANTLLHFSGINKMSKARTEDTAAPIMVDIGLRALASSNREGVTRSRLSARTFKKVSSTSTHTRGDGAWCMLDADGSTCHCGVHCTPYGVITGINYALPHCRERIMQVGDSCRKTPGPSKWKSPQPGISVDQAHQLAARPWA